MQMRKKQEETWEMDSAHTWTRTHVVTISSERYNFHERKHKSQEQNPEDCVSVLYVHMNNTQSQSLTQ